MAEYDIEGEDIDTELPPDSKVLLALCSWTDFDIDVFRTLAHEDQCKAAVRMLSVGISVVCSPSCVSGVEELIGAAIKAFGEAHDIVALRVQLLRAVTPGSSSRKLDAKATLFPSGELDLPGVWHALTSLEVDADFEQRFSSDIDLYSE